MNKTAIVIFQSKTGYTQKYAEWIAEELSFCNSIYFIRAFRKSTGETPLMYRKKRVTVREIR